MFVNKIDRGGADCARVLAEIRRKLTPAALVMTSARDEGKRGAVVTVYAASEADFRWRLIDALAEHDDALLATYLDEGTTVSSRRLCHELQAQINQMLVHPVFYGSAITGAGWAC